MRKIALFVLFQWLALEFALAFFFHFHQDYDAEMWKYTRDLKKNVPDARGHIHLPDARARLMGVDIRTNSLGMRGPEPNPTPPHRLLVLGDSFTLGWGVPEELSYPRLLERKISCKKFEVLNGGVGNYNLEQINMFARTQIRTLHPSALLYGFYWNDAEPLQREPNSFFARHSYLALFWRKIEVRLLHYQLAPASYRSYYAQTFEGESGANFAGEARKLTELAKAERIPLYVVLLPELRAPADPAIGAVYAKVEALFRKEGAQVLNLFGTFPPRETPEAWWVARDDPHPNSEAHKEIAKAIANSFFSPDCTLSPGKL